jgi:hypothetical protein
MQRSNRTRVAQAAATARALPQNHNHAMFLFFFLSWFSTQMFALRDFSQQSGSCRSVLLQLLLADAVHLKPNRARVVEGQTQLPVLNNLHLLAVHQSQASALIIVSSRNHFNGHGLETIWKGKKEQRQQQQKNLFALAVLLQHFRIQNSPHRVAVVHKESLDLRKRLQDFGAKEHIRDLEKRARRIQTVSNVAVILSSSTAVSKSKQRSSSLIAGFAEQNRVQKQNKTSSSPPPFVGIRDCRFSSKLSLKHGPSRIHSLANTVSSH